MKNKIFIWVIISWILVSCNSTLNSVHINRIFIKEEKPLSGWDKDLLKIRTEAFEKLNVNFDSVDTLYLIESYSVENLYYDGLLYLGENQYYHFCRIGFGEDLETLNKGLTNTEKFIIEKLRKNEYYSIKEKSIKTDVMSPSALYVTVSQKKAKNSINFFRLRDFYID